MGWALPVGVKRRSTSHTKVFLAPNSVSAGIKPYSVRRNAAPWSRQTRVSYSSIYQLLKRPSKLGAESQLSKESRAAQLIKRSRTPVEVLPGQQTPILSMDDMYPECASIDVTKPLNVHPGSMNIIQSTEVQAPAVMYTETSGHSPCITSVKSPPAESCNIPGSNPFSCPSLKDPSSVAKERPGQERMMGGVAMDSFMTMKELPN